MREKQILDSSNSVVVEKSARRVDGAYLELRATKLGDPRFITTHLQLGFTNGSTPILWANTDVFCTVCVSFHALFSEVFKHLTTIEAEQVLVSSAVREIFKNANFNDIQLAGEINGSVNCSHQICYNSYRIYNLAVGY